MTATSPNSSPSSRIKALAQVAGLAALSLGLSAPGADLPRAVLIHLALAALLLLLAARFRARDVYGLLALAGLFGLGVGLLDPAPLSAEHFIAKAMGAGTLRALLALAWALLIRAGPGSLALALAAGLLWGGGAAPDALALGLFAGGALLLWIGRGGGESGLRWGLLGPALIAALLAVALALETTSHDARWWIVAAALGGYCLLILWFERRGRGPALLDAPPASIPLAVAFAVGWLVAAPLGDPLGFIRPALLIAFGLAWLPLISLLLGMRALGRAR